MNFGEFLDSVYVTTKRPDKVQDTKDATNRAILKFSLGASFAADLVEGTVAIVATSYSQSFSISTNFTRFRRLYYLKRTNATKFMDLVDARKVFDNCGRSRKDVWYRAGDNIVFTLLALSATLEYGYFQSPPILVDDADEYWMMEELQAMLHAQVCADVFRGIGETTDANTHQTTANQLYAIAIDDLSLGGTAVAK